MQVEQILVEVGRLHLQILELTAENAQLRAALASQAGAPSVAQVPSEDEPETDTEPG